MFYLSSFVHFDYGILSYYMLGFLDDDSKTPVPEETFKSSSLTDRLITNENLGLIVSLYFALSFENVENSPMMIKMFREQSGLKSTSLMRLT